MRFLGLTGHHDPAILQEAMRRFPFDSAHGVERGRYPPPVLHPDRPAEAAQRGMGVIGMKIYAQGALLSPDKLTADAMGYVLSLPGVSTVVVGCRTLPKWTTMCALPVSSPPSIPNTYAGWKRGPRAMRQRVPPIRSPRDVRGGQSSHYSARQVVAVLRSLVGRDAPGAS